MKVKNQHFVPQTYFKAFNNNRPYIWAYDKSTGTSFKGSIQKIASGEYFYDYPPLDDELGEQWLENKFAWLESFYPHKLAELEQNGWVFNESLKEYFAAFFTYQVFRTKAYRESLRHANDQIVSFLAQQENGQTMMKDLGLDKPVTPKDYHIQMLISEAPGKSMDILRSWMWLVLDNRTTTSFLTSDSPVVRLSPIEAEGIEGQQFHLPISNRKGILVFETERPEAIKKSPRLIKHKGWVKSWNELQVVWSYRQVYGQTDHFPLVEKMLERWPNLRDIEQAKIFLKENTPEKTD